MVATAVVFLTLATSTVAAYQDPTIQAAIEARNARQPQKAVATLEYLVARQPQNTIAKIELAVSYNANRQYAKARRLATEVRRNPGNSEALNQALDRFIASLPVKRFISSVPKKHSSAESLKPYLFVGLKYSDNVSLGPGESIIPPFTLGEKGLRHSDFATVIQGGVVHTHQFNDSGSDKPGVRWNSKLTLSDLRYEDHDDFNVTAVRLNTGPVWSRKNDWEFPVQIGYNRTYFGDDHLFDEVMISPTWIKHLEDGKYSPYLSANWGYTDYVGVYDDLDNSTLGLEAGLPWKHDNKLKITPTISYQKQDASSKTYDKYSRSMGVSGEYKFNKNTALEAGYDWKKTNYESLDTNYGVKREDSRETFSLQAVHRTTSGIFANWKWVVS